MKTARGVASRIFTSVHREHDLRVSEIEPHHFVERRAAASRHLPESRDPGLRFEDAAAVPGLVLLDLVWEWRSRPDERHVSSQHVTELWQLVEAGPAQDVAKRRDPFVVDQLEYPRIRRFPGFDRST